MKQAENMSKVSKNKRRVLEVISKKKTRKVNRKLILDIAKLKYSSEFNKFNDETVITSAING